MATRQKTVDSLDVQRRAAEIRRHWSPLEKIRRTGLPPDIPERLRQFILGQSPTKWSTATCAATKLQQTSLPHCQATMMESVPQEYYAEGRITDF
jgi:hypothetical protein